MKQHAYSPLLTSPTRFEMDLRCVVLLPLLVTLLLPANEVVAESYYSRLLSPGIFVAYTGASIFGTAYPRVSSSYNFSILSIVQGVAQLELLAKHTYPNGSALITREMQFIDMSSRRVVNSTNLDTNETWIYPLSQGAARLYMYTTFWIDVASIEVGATVPWRLIEYADGSTYEASLKAVALEVVETSLGHYEAWRFDFPVASGGFEFWFDRRTGFLLRTEGGATHTYREYSISDTNVDDLLSASYLRNQLKDLASRYEMLKDRLSTLQASHTNLSLLLLSIRAEVNETFVVLNGIEAKNLELSRQMDRLTSLLGKREDEIKSLQGQLVLLGGLAFALLGVSIVLGATAIRRARWGRNKSQ